METTRAILILLAKTLADEYAKQLEMLPMKPKVRETIIDGFKDGVRNGIEHTCKMLGVEIKEEQ